MDISHPNFRRHVYTVTMLFSDDVAMSAILRCWAQQQQLDAATAFQFSGAGSERARDP